jgi:hypothetical protein
MNKNRLMFKIVIYTMIIAMLASTLLFSLSFLIN